MENGNQRQIIKDKVNQEDGKQRPELGREIGVDFARARELDKDADHKTKETES